jgi:hypothetical protein
MASGQAGTASIRVNAAAVPLPWTSRVEPDPLVGEGPRLPYVITPPARHLAVLLSLFCYDWTPDCEP